MKADRNETIKDNIPCTLDTHKGMGEQANEWKSGGRNGQACKDR